MANISWDPSYSVGVAELDNQHKKLIRIINELPERLESPDEDRPVASALMSMLDYAKEHFRAEERLMAGATYPALAAHKAEHDRFKEKVLDFIRQYRDGDSLPAMDVLDFGPGGTNPGELGVMLFTNGDRGAGSRGGATADTEALFFTIPGVEVPEPLPEDTGGGDDDDDSG